MKYRNLDNLPAALEKLEKRVDFIFVILILYWITEIVIKAVTDADL